MTRHRQTRPVARQTRPLLLGAAVALGVTGWATRPAAGQSFVNWESPHVHPVDMTPDGTRLLGVNTADNRLEIFDVTTGTPVRTASVAVGLDPVSVRARSNTEAWVVNHVSDSVSVVNLSTLNVTLTVPVGDEPSDVVFAAGRAFVSVTQYNQIAVLDLADLSLPPALLTIEGEGPRALATDGARVYAAIFESGNKTTILTRQAVSSASSPYAGHPNPPPNSGAGFSPPIAGGLPTPPQVGLIVKKMPDSTWQDDNNGDWSTSVSWDLHDHDVAILDASALTFSYASGLMNADMALAVRGSGPGSEVTVVGTDAINHVRFEPNVNGKFVRVMFARFDPATPAAVAVSDMNPHLDYLTSNVPQATRDLSIGDPRGIAWNSAGTVGYVVGMGSNNLVLLDATGARTGRVDEIGDGPTGIVLDEPRNRAYVMCKFGAAIAVIDTAAPAQVGYISFYDPTPASIATGRHYLYNTHLTSGLGQASCASCHIDGRMDQIAWDLGNPAGSVKPFNQICIPGGCESWHPMKGPLMTQTLINIVGTEPLHWRGDRASLMEFNGAFVSLQGRDAQLEPGQISALADLVGSFTNPPNPYRNLDGSLRTSLQVPGSPNTGNPANGQTLFDTELFDGGVSACTNCHAEPTGTLRLIVISGGIFETQSLKIPQLRNLYYKTGFDRTSSSSSRGFGYSHDGEDSTLVSFLGRPEFRFSTNPTLALTQKKDLEAFMFSFSTDTHASVGTQTTVLDGTSVPAPQQALIDGMITLAQSDTVGLVVKGRVKGKARGYMYASATGSFRSDRASEPLLSPATLLSLAQPGGELTYTVVPAGSEQRIGIDRDEDGFFDRTEIDVCSNPADPSDFPGDANSPDRNGDGALTPADIAQYVNDWLNSLNNGNLNADFNADGQVTPADVGEFVNTWFSTLTNPCS